MKKTAEQKLKHLNKVLNQSELALSADLKRTIKEVRKEIERRKNIERADLIPWWRVGLYDALLGALIFGLSGGRASLPSYLASLGPFTLGRAIGGAVAPYSPSWAEVAVDLGRIGSILGTGIAGSYGLRDIRKEMLREATEKLNKEMKEENERKYRESLKKQKKKSQKPMILQERTNKNMMDVLKWLEKKDKGG